MLDSAGIESAGNPLKKDEEELPAIRGLGAKSVEQVHVSVKGGGLIKE